VSAERRPQDDPTRDADLAMALDAQSSLTPYALGVFAVSLPIFAWVASFADNALWLVASLLVFAINWGAFYGAISWLRGEASQDLKVRARVQLIGGLLWAVSVAQMAAFAYGAGAVRETLLLLCAAAAVMCIFFSATSMPALLITTPIAAIGPLMALFSRPETRHAGVMAWARSPWPWPWPWC